ncbi:hypothetical protein J8Z28_17610 [Pseudoalteromonas sp. SCSIO 43088]|uniref:hypothetical protein n=1 Tax=Pseudoalteromonas sp. SCSIO 43088 TaxID=2822846 RepID=UPI00202B1980|nr:hypothetical protein [Pseudoalteromonas sp. SCSIO 43088]URQ86309.1 hypothetical protein J8Z28_17610 [Pseudoalteromonas sp. SCSIO 43088]
MIIIKDEGSNNFFNRKNVNTNKLFNMEYKLMRPKKGFNGNYDDLCENLECMFDKCVKYTKSDEELCCGWIKSMDITNFMNDYKLAPNEISYKTRHTCLDFVTVLSNILIRGNSQLVKKKLKKDYSSSIIRCVVKSIEGSKHHKSIVESMVCGYMYTKTYQIDKSDLNTILVEDIDFVSEYGIELNEKSINFKDNNISASKIKKILKNGIVITSNFNRDSNNKSSI